LPSSLNGGGGNNFIDKGKEGKMTEIITLEMWQIIVICYVIIPFAWVFGGFVGWVLRDMTKRSV
jgi:hypothetical protein